MRKNKDFLHNLREIAFAHYCEIISKFRAIFTRNVKNLCAIIARFSIGNPICGSDKKIVWCAFRPHHTVKHLQKMQNFVARFMQYASSCQRQF